MKNPVGFWEDNMLIRLVVYLRDGCTLSGTYDYAGVLARLEFAATMPEYDGFDLPDAC